MIHLISICVLATLAGSTDALSKGPGKKDWSQFRGPSADGTWNPPSLPADVSAIATSQRWQQPVGAGYGGVTVSDGRVYLMDRQTEPEEVERVLCFDARNGELLWSQSYPVSYGGMEYGSGPRASVVVEGGRAYTLGGTGVAMCLGAINGQVIWRKDTIAEFGATQPKWGFAASPVVWKDTVLIHCGANPGGSVVALSIADGKERWRGGNDPTGYCTPVLHEDQIVQWGPKHLMLIEPGTGKERWRFPYEITYGVSIAQPIIHEGIVFVSGYWHGARALRVADGSLVWSEEKTLCGLMSQPLYRDGHVYLLTKAEGVICFRLSDGEIRWKDGHQFTAKERNPHVSLVWADQKRGIAAGLNARGELLFARLAPDGFEIFSRQSILGKTWAHPAFDRNTIFARSDSELVAWQMWPLPGE